jgi:glycosyltransferase involved in cell wall biosynthesis
MPRICIITHSYPRFQGDWSSNFIEALALAYVRNGAEVTVLVPFTGQVDRASEDTTSIKIVTYKYMPFESLHTIGYGHSMVGDLKINFGDILLMPFMLLIGTIKLVTLLRKEKIDYIHAHWAVPNALIAILGRYFAHSKVRILTSFPGSDVTVLTNLGWFGRILGKIIARSDYLSCNSSDLREDLVKLGLDKDRIDYVIYGVDEKQIHFSEMERKSLRKGLGISDDVIVLLMIGRFVPKKGFSTGFQSLKYITKQRQNIKLVVVGDGQLKDEYLAIIKQGSTAPYVSFIGEIQTQDLGKYYSACDIFLMPSRRLPSDGLNVVVCEAMACSRAIVASNVGGNGLVVFHGFNGYLHEENNPQQLAEFVLRLSDSSALRNQMGDNSLKLVRERFNWDAIAEYYLRKYHEIDLR